MEQIEKPQNVSGGKIWKPKSDEDLQTLKAWQEEELKKEKILENLVLLFSYIAIITLTGVVLYNGLKTYEYTSADKSFVFNQNLLPQFGSEGSWVSLTLIAVSFIFLVAAIFITWRDYLLVAKDVFSIAACSILMIGALAVASLSYSESSAASAWLYVSKNLIVAPEDIPLENGKTVDNITATTQDEQKVTITLEVKNNKLYMTNQTKAAGK